MEQYIIINTHVDDIGWCLHIPLMSITIVNNEILITSI